MTQQELLELFEEYLNEKGKYWDFIQWLKDRGENPQELGFEDDND